jgi:hypothetical protein
MDVPFNWADEVVLVRVTGCQFFLPPRDLRSPIRVASTNPYFRIGSRIGSRGRAARRAARLGADEPV